MGYEDSLDADENMAIAAFEVARAIRNLGNADASTPMGGLEALGKVIGESNERLSDSIGSIADAIYRLAEAVELLAKRQ